MNFWQLHVPQNEEMILEDEIFFNDIPENEWHTNNIDNDNKMTEYFLYLLSTYEMPNPISLQEIQKNENADHELL